MTRLPGGASGSHPAEGGGDGSTAVPRVQAVTLNVNRRGWQTIMNMLAAWSHLPDILGLQEIYEVEGEKRESEARFPQISYDVFRSGSGGEALLINKALGKCPRVWRDDHVVSVEVLAEKDSINPWRRATKQPSVIVQTVYLPDSSKPPELFDERAEEWMQHNAAIRRVRPRARLVTIGDLNVKLEQSGLVGDLVVGLQGGHVTEKVKG